MSERRPVGAADWIIYGPPDGPVAEPVEVVEEKD